MSYAAEKLKVSEAVSYRRQSESCKLAHQYNKSSLKQQAYLDISVHI